MYALLHNLYQLNARNELSPGLVCILSFQEVIGYCPVYPKGHLLGTTCPPFFGSNNIFLNTKHHLKALFHNWNRNYIIQLLLMRYHEKRLTAYQHELHTYVL